ncbi:hypothetical protein DXG01_010257 [Tephrocybe rancida]|nr:hypothetical protein DXG01_010257 [Tephrocybe rancida]
MKPTQRRNALSRFPDDVWQMICFQSNVRDLKSLAEAAPERCSFIHAHITKTIHRVFSNLGVDTRRVLEILESTGSVISGSTVLAILNPWTFKPGDLDVYVPRSAGTEVRVRFQTTYAVQIVPQVNDRFPLYGDLADIHDVITLRSESISINLIVSRTDNPLLPIFNFHSTVVMNFLSSTDLFCAYPDLTFNYLNLVNMNVVGASGGVGDKLEESIAKYIRRGYDFNAYLTDWPGFNHHACMVHPACPSTLRFVSDGHGFRYWLHNLTTHDIGSAVDLEGEVKFGWKLNG